MNKIVNIPDREPAGSRAIEEEARAWLVQLDAGRPSREELAEFHDWLDRSPYHREAFKRSTAVWRDMDELARVLDSPTVDKPESRKAAQWFGFRTSQSAVVALILAVALTAATATFLNLRIFSGDEVFSAEYRTAIGEHRPITLPDGSSMQVNTNSRIDVAYDRNARIIRLLEGEAWFDVRHSDEKPFMVYAGRYIVRAVGTAFSVRLNGRKIDLTVTEGRVEVASLKDSVLPQARQAPPSIDLAPFRVPVVAGQYMRLDDNLQVASDKIELVQQVGPQQIEKQLSWRDGVLMFDNDTLEEVVAEINRYTPMKIVISESELRGLRLGGYFQAGDVESILTSLEKSYGITAEEVNPGLVYLSRRQDNH